MLHHIWFDLSSTLLGSICPAHGTYEPLMDTFPKSSPWVLNNNLSLQSATLQKLYFRSIHINTAFTFIHIHFITLGHIKIQTCNFVCRIYAWIYDRQDGNLIKHESKAQQPYTTIRKSHSSLSNYKNLSLPASYLSVYFIVVRLFKCGKKYREFIKSLYNLKKNMIDKISLSDMFYALSSYQSFFYHIALVYFRYPADDRGTV